MINHIQHTREVKLPAFSLMFQAFDGSRTLAPSGESFECDVKSELAKIDSIITEIKMPVKDAVYTVRNLMEKTMHNPGIAAYMNSSEQIKGGSWSGSDVSRLMKLMMPDIISAVTQKADRPGNGQARRRSGTWRRRPRTRALGGDADANLAGKRPAGYSGAGVSREPLPKGMGALPLESTQDGENVSKVLRQVSPAVEQAFAAGANSGQPSSAQDGENSSTIFNLNELLATLEKASAAGESSEEPSSAQDGENSSAIFNLNELLAALEQASAAGESSGEPSSAQDGENSSAIFNLNELLAALEKASAAGESSGQRSSAQPDNVGDEEGSGA